MGTALARACVYGCPHDARTCPTHSRQAKVRTYDQRRGSAHSRGYGARWRHYTQWYRDEQARLHVPRAGLCGGRLPGAPITTDSTCQQQDLTVLGTVVDHIIPVTGPHDPTFYLPTAHQLLCASCHDRKRQREAMAVR